MLFFCLTQYRRARIFREWASVDDSFREIHPAHKILEAWIRAQAVDPQVGLQEVRKVGGSFLVRFFEVFESLVFVSQTRVDRSNHIRRNVVGFRLAQEFVEDFLRLCLSPCSCIGVRQFSDRVLIALRLTRQPSDTQEWRATFGLNLHILPRAGSGQAMNWNSRLQTLGLSQSGLCNCEGGS
jgi:hypothetical protein